MIRGNNGFPNKSWRAQCPLWSRQLQPWAEGWLPPWCDFRVLGGSPKALPTEVLNSEFM